MAKKSLKKILKPVPEKIPSALHIFEWVCWIAILTKGIWQKIPVNPKTGKAISATKRKTWWPIETVLKFYHLFAGIGIVLTKNLNLTVIDLDNCRNAKTGKIKKWAVKFIKRFNSYTEVSPSGTGVKIFIYGNLPVPGCRKGDIEIYSSGRFMTVTGHVLKISSPKIKKKQKTLDEVYNEIFNNDAKSSTKQKISVGIKPAPASNKIKERLGKAFKSKNGSKIQDLYDGHVTPYQTPSEADMALVCHLTFWFGGDDYKIDEAFRSSALYRSKWDSRRGNSTYGKITIAKALRIVTNYYDSSSSTATKPNLLTVKMLMGMDLPPIIWIIPTLLVAGLSILGGSPKMGKSWLSLQLGLAVSKGITFLGKKPKKRSGVLMICLEDSFNRLQNRIEKLLNEKKLPKNLHLATEWPKMNAGGIKALRDFIKSHPKVKLVIIDTLQHFRSSAPNTNKNIYQIDTDEMSRIKQIADEFNIAILVIHHLRKAFASDQFEQFTGSTGITGTADSLYYFGRQRGENTAIFIITGRDIPEKALKLRFNKKRHKWIYKGKAKLFKRSYQRQRIIDLLIKHGKPLGPKKVAKKLDAVEKYANIRKLMSKMAKDGELEKVDRGLYIVPKDME